MSLFDDIQEYGAGALETLGEGVEDFVSSYAKTKGEEAAANPDTHAQVDTARESDGSLAAHQQRQGFIPMASNNTLLIAGGVILLVGVGFALMRKG